MRAATLPGTTLPCQHPAVANADTVSVYKNRTHNRESLDRVMPALALTRFHDLTCKMQSIAQMRTVPTKIVLE